MHRSRLPARSPADPRRLSPAVACVHPSRHPCSPGSVAWIEWRRVSAGITVCKTLEKQSKCRYRQRLQSTNSRWVCRLFASSVESACFQQCHTVLYCYHATARATLASCLHGHGHTAGKRRREHYGERHRQHFKVKGAQGQTVRINSIIVQQQ